MSSLSNSDCGGDFHGNACMCFIVPASVLERLSRDKKLSAMEREAFAVMAKYEQEWRKLRLARVKHLRAAKTILPSALAAVPAGSPSVNVFDCQQGTTLPGTLLANPDGSADGTVKRASDESKSIVKFFKTLFGRNSIDDAGMAINSSVHYSVKYNNAFWNGSQMAYGDGDGKIFLDFTRSNDVIGHELTHGITQYTLSLNYTKQAGGLNESMSDVFGSMFRQWEANQDVSQADWLIGKDIMGPAAKARGYTCLRDLSNPNASHCLAPQPTKFSQYHDAMDPHESSGIPNLAFYKAAMVIGGKSWEKAGKIWYQALTGSGPSPNMRMSTFAKRTRTLAGSLFPSEPVVKKAVDQAWKSVGL